METITFEQLLADIKEAKENFINNTRGLKEYLERDNCYCKMHAFGVVRLDGI